MTQPEPSALSGAPGQPGPSAGTAGDGTAVAPPPEGGQSATPPAEPVQPATVSAAEFERLRVQLSAADKKREEAQRELQAIRDKDLPEIDRLQRDTAALTETNQRLTNQLKEQAVELAFLRDNKVRWKDSAAALKLLDRTQVQISDDGTVDGIKLASEKLAKQYPWMVDDAKPDGAPTATPPAGGAPPMNGKSGSTDGGNTKGMVSRLPALGSRRRPSQ
jgi:hypothetical protein